MKIDKFCAVYFALVPATYAKSSRNFRGSNILQDAKTKETMQHIRKDMKKILEAKEGKDNEDMEAALFSFYGNRQALKEKGIDGSIVKDFDTKVDAILNMPDIGEAWHSSDIDLMEYDLQNIMDAKSTQDDGDMEAALRSFYGNRKTLKDKGVDEDIIKEFDREVDGILNMPEIGKAWPVQGKSKEPASSDRDLMWYDIQNIMNAKNTHNDEDIETALHSFYRNRETLKDKGVDEDSMKEFDREVNAIIKKPGIRTMSSDIFVLEQDLQNIMDAKESQDDEGMEEALHSFYMNRKTLKDKGVDEKTVMEYDREVHSILEKLRAAKSREDVKEAMRNIRMDMRKILKAKKTQDDEGMETALYSFYGNRKTLEEEGVNESILTDFDAKVEVILNKPDLKKGKSEDYLVGELMDLIEDDVQNIRDAKEIQDDEGMEDALHSFHNNRKALTGKGIDAKNLKYVDDKVDEILSTM